MTLSMKIILNDEQSFESYVLKDLGVDIDSPLFEDIEQCYMETENTIEFLPVMDFKDEDLAECHGMELICEKEEDTNSYIVHRYGNRKDIAESVYGLYIGNSKLEKSFGNFIFNLIEENIPYLDGGI